MRITASDRFALIRLASEMPAGSSDRRLILAGLKIAVNHGLRNGQKVPYQGVVLVADTKSDPEWVMLLKDGEPVARQSKGTAGTVFQQWTPDYTGRQTLPLETYHPTLGWQTYDSQAKPNGILYMLTQQRLRLV